MMRRLREVGELAAAHEMRDLIAADDTTFSPRWLVQSNALVVAQESGRHLEPDEAPLVAKAFTACGVDSLIAVTNDSLMTIVEAYELSAHATDLNLLSDELIGINFLLADASYERCILFTAYDFKLIAGSRQFITAVAGDPMTTREEFIDFYSDQLEPFRTTAIRAAAYMDWIVAPPQEPRS